MTFISQTQADLRASEDIKMCNTDKCKTAGKFMRDCMNTSVNPCDDFNLFACGGWLAKTDIPESRIKLDSNGVLDELLQETEESELRRSLNESEAKSVTFAKKFFKTCTDYRERSE